MAATLVLNQESTSINRKNFSVVHFKLDNNVEAVPSKWITVDNQCWWPRNNLPNFKKTLQDSSFVPGEDWIKYEVQIIKSYGMVNHKLKINFI